MYSVRDTKNKENKEKHERESECERERQRERERERERERDFTFVISAISCLDNAKYTRNKQKQNLALQVENIWAFCLFVYIQTVSLIS